MWQIVRLAHRRRFAIFPRQPHANKVNSLYRTERFRFEFPRGHKYPNTCEYSCGNLIATRTWMFRSVTTERLELSNTNRHFSTKLLRLFPFGYRRRHCEWFVIIIQILQRRLVSRIPGDDTGQCSGCARTQISELWVLVEGTRTRRLESFEVLPNNRRS